MRLLDLVPTNLDLSIVVSSIHRCILLACKDVDSVNIWLSWNLVFFKTLLAMLNLVKPFEIVVRRAFSRLWIHFLKRSHI